MAGQVVKEAHVAVGTVAQVKAVDPYVAVGHHAVEGNIDVTVGVSGGQQKALAIPGDSGGEEASGRAAEVFLVNRAGDAPVMGHGDASPG